MSDALRIAVVGYGQVARLHAEITLAESQILHRVVGRDPDRTAAFAKEFDIAHHGTSLDEALTDDAVDAVILGSPNDVHADQARRCILAGKPVLVEIPLAMSAGGHTSWRTSPGPAASPSWSRTRTATSPACAASSATWRRAPGASTACSPAI
ncbi:Gfo/Idh/MocA family oxidoreductase [Streptomyces sp. MS1.HAVA.3]|uniref:Gfo/Idh/MocA family oxidoreductase n=1 Tax=Streptomyces caledonius TaxID=3134107 RepID=A0ABU8TZT7_9ACTN